VAILARPEKCQGFVLIGVQSLPYRSLPIRPSAIILPSTLSSLRYWRRETNTKYKHVAFKVKDFGTKAATKISIWHQGT